VFGRFETQDVVARLRDDMLEVRRDPRGATVRAAAGGRARLDARRQRAGKLRPADRVGSRGLGAAVRFHGAQRSFEDEDDGIGRLALQLRNQAVAGIEGALQQDHVVAGDHASRVASRIAGRGRGGNGRVGAGIAGG